MSRRFALERQREDAVIDFTISPQKTGWSERDEEAFLAG